VERKSVNGQRARRAVKKVKFAPPPKKKFRLPSDTFCGLPAPLAVERCAANRTP
jgi:hypothetical protein